MKKITTLIAAVFIGGSIYAQQPSPDPDTLQNPVKQIDPTPTHIPPSANYTEGMRKITADEVPAPIKRTLEGREYEGWEKYPLFKSKDGNVYLLQMNTGDRTKIYRFNKEGQPLEDEK